MISPLSFFGPLAAAFFWLGFPVLLIIILILTAATAAELANDGIRGIFGNDIWRVDHVELRSSILACEGQDGELAARVLRQNRSHVQHTVVEDNPAVTLRSVLCNLLHREATATTSTALLGFFGLLHRRRSGCLRTGALVPRTGALVHAVLV